MTSALPQPDEFPRTRPQTTPNAAAVISADARDVERRPALPKLSSSRRSTNGIAISPIGTLTQKIHDQSMPRTIAPPTIGPSATAIPVTALNSPIAVPRFSAGNAAVRIASASGRMNAAPAPWTARAAIRKPASGLSAHAADASENRARPTANMRLRPNRSPSAAAGISSTAKLRL